MLTIYDGRACFWQWDINQKLVVESGHACEVHFRDPNGDAALVVDTYTIDGQTVANVPNVLMQDTAPVIAWVYICEGDECTKHEARFTVRPRQKPADYVYTETEVKTYLTLEKRLDEIEANGVPGGGGGGEDAAARAESAAQAAQASADAAKQSQQAASLAAGSATKAAERAEAAAEICDDLAPAIVHTVTDDVVNVVAPQREVKGLASTITCVQDGTGTPSSDNVRPLSGHDTVSLYWAAAYDEAAAPNRQRELPEAVYGGTLDWLTGVLTVTHICITVTGAGVIQYGVASTGIPYVRHTLPQLRATGEYGVSSHYPVTGVVPSGAGMRVYQTNTLFVYDSRFTDQATAVALLNTEMPQLVYPLATPYTVQLDAPAMALTMLEGSNALWSSTGNTTLTYIADTKAYIDELIASLLNS